MRISSSAFLICALALSFLIGRTLSAQTLSAECQQKLLGLASALSDYQSLKVELSEKHSLFDELDQKKTTDTLNQEEEATWTALRQEIYLQEQTIQTSRDRLEQAGSSAHASCQG